MTETLPDHSLALPSSSMMIPAAASRLTSVTARSPALAIDYRPNFPFSEEQGSIGDFVLQKQNTKAGLPRVAVPKTINRFLREYQREGVSESS